MTKPLFLLSAQLRGRQRLVVGTRQMIRVEGLANLPLVGRDARLRILLWAVPAES